MVPYLQYRPCFFIVLTSHGHLMKHMCVSVCVCVCGNCKCTNRYCPLGRSRTRSWPLSLLTLTGRWYPKLFAASLWMLVVVFHTAGLAISGWKEKTRWVVNYVFLVYTLWKRDRSLFLYKLLDEELGQFLWVLVAPFTPPTPAPNSYLHPFSENRSMTWSVWSKAYRHWQSRQFLYNDQLFYVFFTFLLIFPPAKSLVPEQLFYLKIFFFGKFGKILFELNFFDNSLKSFNIHTIVYILKP